LTALGIHVSIGHTDTDYEVASRAFLLGVGRTTHIFNAMRPLHHRDPGSILASLNFSPFVEVIPDFVHVDKELVKFLIKAVGEDRLVGVTDSIMTAGLGDGEYSLGKMSITVKGGRALTKYGKLAGSTLTMDTAFVNLTNLAGLRVAIMMTSYNPARAIGLSDRGVIMPGKRADLMLSDEKLRIVKVFVKGVGLSLRFHEFVFNLSSSFPLSGSPCRLRELNHSLQGHGEPHRTHPPPHIAHRVHCRALFYMIVRNSKIYKLS